ncbi:NAD(P)-dependent dehydrogenase (short-subunit alcohol dehydrogenase family) [Rhizobium sp. BK650]|uniref:SDR family NAD(P)-dependent oxidoreductase n=1 Tax=Rhizobium sp. BK650 TaxID=2586990 RepID=UPI0016202071|nr:SDR family NAD(P)-dependent oxidoreductase [Rhizobium sp. BK650]MBB3657250.1 NAD(P)-dependent dehydrogenase (short-subunit alcohol dehydrogenase family) [Rhizobium sp. BK650]
MENAQHPIGSGFGARSTADEVLAGIDLSGKLAIVTGGHSGLGLETTKALSRAGAHVLVGARRLEEAAKALVGIANVEVERLDLSDLESVRRFAERFVASGHKADMVINSAGIMACPETRVGPGWEAQFATNHLGHFALVNHLRPAIGSGARVIAVSSGAHGITPIRWSDVQFLEGYDRWQAYGQSKTANALFAVHLDRRGKDAGIRAFSLHPGKILTPLQRHLEKEDMVAAGWIDAEGNAADPSFKTPAQGATTQVWAATSPRLEGLGGLYCADCDVATISDDGAETSVRAYAVDPDEAARLWTLSAELTGVDAFSS